MSKFQVGDRVRCIAVSEVGHAGVVGRVYTVFDTEGGPNGSISLDTTETNALGCDADRFELYAKVGEFVVGDVVTVDEAFTNRGTSFEATGVVKVTSIDGKWIGINGDMGAGWNKGRFRLATPEEIAAAEAKFVQSSVNSWEEKMNAAIDFGEDKTVETILSPEAAAKWKVFAEMIDGANVFKPEIGKTVFHHAGEIPAADFDFSTIRAGDQILVRMKVSDVHHPDSTLRTDDPELYDGGAYIPFSRIVSVIPAPKPKTMRERAIEAAMGVTPAGNERQALNIVDAVLAEVEKGQ